MRIPLSMIALCLCVNPSQSRSQEPEQQAGHASGHAAHAASAPVTPQSFAGTECPPADPATRADMTALGIIERCADIDVQPNVGGFKLVTYLPVNAARAGGNTADGMVVETAPGRATFRIADTADFAGYTVCNLDRSVLSEIPRSGRFKPKHGWVYRDARTASYEWDVKARVSQGSTAPRLHVLAYLVAIPRENLASALERRWCKPTAELEDLQRD